MENSSREQMVQCFIDLANRSRELGNNSLYAILLVLAADTVEGTEDTLALFLGEYAKMRMLGMPPIKKKDQTES